MLFAYVCMERGMLQKSGLHFSFPKNADLELKKKKCYCKEEDKGW